MEMESSAKPLTVLRMPATREFLSTLISLPKVFASFSTEQFLSVFAIILPYSVGPTPTKTSSHPE